MCMVCEYLPSLEHWTAVNPGTSSEGRQRSFHSQTACLATVATFYGLSVRPELAGSAYMTSDKKGKAVLCRTIDEVWVAMGELLGREPDALDPELVGALESMRDQARGENR
jgi:hypothetical protein